MAQIWTTKCDFNIETSLDDSHFDMENYSPLVDVTLLLKRILDSNQIKFVFSFVLQFASFMLESKVQPPKNV